MDAHQRRIVGAEARQLLENSHLQEAFDAVRDYLEAVALSTDPDNKEKAQRVVISMQLLKAVKREIERKIEDGQVAEVEMRELEPKRRFSVFQR